MLYVLIYVTHYCCDLLFKSMQKHINKHIQQERLKTQMKDGKRVRLNSAGVYLPQIATIQEIQGKKRDGKGSRIKEKLAQDLTFDDMELIRNQVSLFLVFSLSKKLLYIYLR